MSEVRTVAGHVVVTQTILRDAMAQPTVLESVRQSMAAAANEMYLDIMHGPRSGPHRVRNDSEQAEEERRALLAEELLDLAAEWGVYDLVRGDY